LETAQDCAPGVLSQALGVIPNPAARVSVKPTLQIMALELPAAEQATAEIREEFKRMSDMARKTGLGK
jgi:hypothetical protein